MNNLYEAEQLVKIRQQEICQSLCNRPRTSKHKTLSSLTQKVKEFFA